jgi:hypothetical protein
MLRYPANAMPRQLKEIVRFIKLPFKERLKKHNTDCSWIRYVMRAYKGHLPDDGSSVTMDALRVISNSQLHTLLDTGEVEVDQCHPSPTSMKQLQLDTSKSPFGPPNTSTRVSQFKRPILSLVASPRDQFPTEVGQYQLALQYMDGPQQHRFYSMTIDPLLTEIPAQNKVSTVADPKVDIRPHGVTASVIRTTCQHALKQLGKVSGMQIVSEAFVTPPLVLLQSTGSAEAVLNAICRAYRYNWRKVGDTYLVYSQAWAQDRQADIPQHILYAWNQSIAEHGYVTLHVLGQMSRMTKWQMPTITYSTGFQLAHRQVFHFLGTLSSPDLQESSQPTGFTYYPTRLAANLLDTINPGELTIPPYNIKTHVRLDPGKKTPDHATVIIVDSAGNVLAAIREPLTDFLKYEDDLAGPAHASARTG